MNARRARPPDPYNGEGHSLERVTLLKQLGRLSFETNNTTWRIVLCTHRRNSTRRVSCRWNRYCGWDAELPV